MTAFFFRTTIYFWLALRILAGPEDREWGEGPPHHDHVAPEIHLGDWQLLQVFTWIFHSQKFTSAKFSSWGACLCWDHRNWKYLLILHDFLVRSIVFLPPILLNHGNDSCIFNKLLMIPPLWVSWLRVPHLPRLSRLCQRGDKLHSGLCRNIWWNWSDVRKKNLRKKKNIQWNQKWYQVQ